MLLYVLVGCVHCHIFELCLFADLFSTLRILSPMYALVPVVVMCVCYWVLCSIWVNQYKRCGTVVCWPYSFQLFYDGAQAALYGAIHLTTCVNKPLLQTIYLKPRHHLMPGHLISSVAWQRMKDSMSAIDISLSGRGYANCTQVRQYTLQCTWNTYKHPLTSPAQLDHTRPIFLHAKR